MTLSETIGALRRVGPRWLALAVVGGAAVGAATCLGLRYLLPAQLAESLLPFAAGVADGLVCLLAIGALRDGTLRRPLLLVLIATLVAIVYLGAMIAVEPEALRRRAFGFWSPSVGAIALAVWVAAALWELRAGRRLAPFTAILAGLALSATLLNNGSSVYRALSGDYIRAWNVYHYYVGSKYFAELGYDDLYAATLAADDEWRRSRRGATPEEWGRMALTPDFSDIAQTRSMETYLRIPRAKATAGFSRELFSDERFEQLGRDTRALRPHLDPGTWKAVLTDLGFNPSPAWSVLGTPIANLVPIDRPASWLIANSDLPLLLVMFGAVWWAFGPRAAFVALVWLNAIHFNRGRFAGGFLQYDWLVSMVVGFALYHKGRARAAGVVYSWGVMTRAFPAFLVFPIAVGLAADLVRNRRGDPGVRRPGLLSRLDPRRLRFVAALALACAAIFGLSHLTGRGLDAWPEWGSKIARHSHLHPVMDPQRIGVGRLVLHEPSADDPWAAARGDREEQLQQSGVLKRAIQIAGLLLLAAALVRRRDEDAMALMLFGVFLILTLSRYYASAWILLLFLEARPDGPGRPRLAPVLAGGFLLLMAAVFHAVGSRTGRYFLVNYEALAMFVALCTLFLVATLRERLRSRRDAARIAPP